MPFKHCPQMSSARPGQKVSVVLFENAGISRKKSIEPSFDSTFTKDTPSEMDVRMELFKLKELEIVQKHKLRTILHKQEMRND